MTNEKTFKASNGYEIRSNFGYFDEHEDCYEVRDSDEYILHRLGQDALQALREFFQHERDQELGLWRWPENPDYVAKMANTYEIAVIHEPTFWRHRHVHFTDARLLAEFMNEKPGKNTKPWRCAARAFLRQNPIKRPWHDAQPGEVWLITVNGRETIAVASRTSFRHSFDQDDVGHFIDIRGSDITAGRKLLNADGSVVDE